MTSPSSPNSVSTASMVMSISFRPKKVVVSLIAGQSISPCFRPQ